MIVNHLDTGASPSTDRRAIDSRLNTEADKGMAGLIAFAILNPTLLQNCLPSPIQKVVLVDEFPSRTRENECFRIVLGWFNRI